MNTVTNHPDFPRAAAFLGYSAFSDKTEKV